MFAGPFQDLVGFVVLVLERGLLEFSSHEHKVGLAQIVWDLKFYPVHPVSRRGGWSEVANPLKELSEVLVD